MPVRGGSLERLREGRYINVKDDASWRQLIGSLLATVSPAGPYPVLLLTGEQGSAKSTAARVIRSLIDPSESPLRAEPREVRDLLIAARNGWVVALDNLSGMPSWLSDALCRLATGGGFATRALYTNEEEVILDAQRPTVVTGIWSCWPTCCAPPTVSRRYAVLAVEGLVAAGSTGQTRAHPLIASQSALRREIAMGWDRLRLSPRHRGFVEVMPSGRLRRG